MKVKVGEGQGQVDVEIDVEQGLADRGIFDTWPSASQRWSIIDAGRERDLDALDELRADLVVSSERILGAAAEVVSAFRYNNQNRPHVHASDPDQVPSPTCFDDRSADVQRFIRDTWTTLNVRVDAQQGRFVVAAVVDSDNIWLVHRTPTATIPAHRRIGQPTDPDPVIISEIITAQPEGISANTATLSECTWLTHHPEDPDGVICGPAGTTVITPDGAWALDYHPATGIHMHHPGCADALAACLAPPPWRAQATLDRLANRGNDPPALDR